MSRNLEDYFKNYSNHPFENYQIQYRKRKVLERLKLYNPKNILEVGCGHSSQIFKEKNFKYLKILEPSFDFYRQNLTEITNSNLQNVSIENKYFENFENTLEIKFDLILISSLLHEITDLEQFFLKLEKLMNENTVTHINVPNANSLHRLLAQNMGIINSTKDYSQNNIRLQTKNIFDRESLTELVKKYNFKIIDEGSYFIKPFTHSQMQKIIDAGIINAEILDGFYNLLDQYNFGSEIFIEFKKA